MNVAIPQFQIRKPRKAKGPAEVAASPSHGSRAYAKETKNDMTDSTPAAGLTNRAPIYALEALAGDLERLSSILDRLLDITFYNPRRTREPDGLIMLPIHEGLIDDALFVAHKIGKLSVEIGDAVTRALNDHIKREGTGAVPGGHAINELVASLRGGETASELVQAAVKLARKGVAA
jgi:hypothetical protein